MGSKLVILDDVITSIAAGPFGSNLKVSCFVKEGFPIIDGANLKGFKLTDNITKFVTEEKARSLSRSIAKRNDVVVTISGTLGQIAYIPYNSEYQEYLCSQRQFKVTFNEERVYVPYIVYYFHTKEGQSKILAFANQTGVPALSQPTKNFRRIALRLPSLDEQRRIVKIGELISEKIDLIQKTNDYLVDLLTTLQRQVADTSSTTEYHAAEVFSIHIGKTPPRKQHEWFSRERTDNVIWMSIKDMGNADAYLVDSSEYLTTQAVERFNIKKCRPGSVLLSFKLTIGRVGIVANEMVTNEAIACFTSDDRRQLAYLYPLLLRYDFASMGSTSSIATAVNSKLIKSMPLEIPSDDVLDEYYHQSKPVYDLLLSNTKETIALKQLRDSLLPKLMSGEIDVSNIELPTPPNNHLAAYSQTAPRCSVRVPIRLHRPLLRANRMCLRLKSSVSACATQPSPTVHALTSKRPIQCHPRHPEVTSHPGLRDTL